jgi:hypothetical protein
MVRQLIFVACCLAAGFSQAAVLTIRPEYVQSFDASLAPLGALPNNGAGTPVGGYLQFGFRIELDGAAANEDFWTAAFDVNLGPGLQQSSGWLDPGIAQTNGYYPAGLALAQYDANGATAGGINSQWDYSNADFGLDPNDLRSIIVETSPPQASNRQYGEPTRPGAGFADDLGSPTLIGAILVQRIDLVPTFVGVSPIAGSPWGTYVDNAAGDGTATSQSGTSFRSESVSVGVPEPSAMLLAGMGGAMALLFGRRGFVFDPRPRRLSGSRLSVHRVGVLMAKIARRPG